MKIKNMVIMSLFVVALTALTYYGTGMTTDKAYGQAAKYGSVGGVVWELQNRLEFLGYYHGEVDGQFGSLTRQGVVSFQQAFGLQVDGIAGEKTMHKLRKATTAWNPQAQEGGQAAPPASNRRGLSENDIQLMANAVYGEARGEPYEGQVAVAAVILNRINSELFPNSVSGVIFEPRAFTAVADGQIWLQPNETAKRAVMEALNGIDPTNGCLYYFNPDTATSAWIWTRPQIKTIGKHIFCM